MHRDLSECLKLRPGTQNVEAILVVHPGYAPDQLDADTVVYQLEASGINRRAIDREALERLVAHCHEQPSEKHEARIASGRAPVAGQPGRFEFAPRVQAQIESIERRARDLEQAGDLARSDQAINFREQSAFVVVDRGQVIGQIVPPTDGEDGEDVYGQAIEAKQGAGCPIDFKDNVRIRHGTIVEATRAGLLEYQRDVIAVDPVLTIRGAVDFSTGNIRFPGDVIVDKGIKDQFVVEAGGSLTVRGLIEAATIKISKHAELLGGMAGRQQGTIDIGKSLDAKYLDGVSGVVRGPLTIRNEANNCQIEVQGPLLAVNASIRDGLYQVIGSADVGAIGGQGGVVTELILGSLKEQEDVARRTMGLIPELERVAADAERKLDDLKRNVHKLTATQAEELTELEFAAAEAHRDLERVRASTDRLAGLMLGMMVARLTIRRRACAGVRVWVPGFVVEFRNTVPGPLEMTLNEQGRVEFRNPDSGHTLALDRDVRVARDDRVLSLDALRSLRPAA